MKALLPSGLNYDSWSFFSTKIFAITIPNSNNIHAGIASNDCEMISGGVMSIPTVKHPIIT